MQRFTYLWCAHLAQRSNYMTSVGHMSMNLAVEKLVLRYLSTGSENFIIELLTIWIQTNEKFSVPHANWLTVHDDSKSFNVAKEQKWEILSRTTLDTKNARIVHGTYAKKTSTTYASQSTTIRIGQIQSTDSEITFTSTRVLKQVLASKRECKHVIKPRRGS